MKIVLHDPLLRRNVGLNAAGVARNLIRDETAGIADIFHHDPYFANIRGENVVDPQPAELLVGADTVDHSELRLLLSGEVCRAREAADPPTLGARLAQE